MKDINNLLQKYWEAETSLEEEAIIKNYFKTGDISSEHKVYTPLFEVYRHDGAMTSSVNVEELFKNELEKENSLKSTSVEKKTEASVFSLKKYIPAIAAVFLTVLASVTVFNMFVDTAQMANVTVLEDQKDQEEAIKITKEALALLSSNYTKGTDAIKKTHHIEKVDIFRTN